MTKEKWLEMCEKIAPHMDAIQEIRNEYLGKDDAMLLMVSSRICSVTYRNFDCAAFREQPYHVVFQSTTSRGGRRLYFAGQMIGS